MTLGFGGANGKVFLETTLAEPGSSARVTGGYATRGRQHLDFDTRQEHAAPDTVSDLAFRGILADRSSAVWRGMIKVDPGAQRIDAFQECRNLLVSKKAHADAIPGLEILANDVRCTHAAAIAQIDPEQVFYLRSRGLDEDDAKRLVVEGFLGSLLERFPEGPLRDALAGALDHRLAVLLGDSLAPLRSHRASTFLAEAQQLDARRRARVGGHNGCPESRQRPARRRVRERQGRVRPAALRDGGNELHDAVDQRLLVWLELLLAHARRERLEDRVAHLGLDARQRLDDRQAAERDELRGVAALVGEHEAAAAQPVGGVDHDLREPAEAARARASSARAGPSRWHPGRRRR